MKYHPLHEYHNYSLPYQPFFSPKYLNSFAEGKSERKEKLMTKEDADTDASSDASVEAAAAYAPSFVHRSRPVVAHVSDIYASSDTSDSQWQNVKSDRTDDHTSRSWSDGIDLVEKRRQASRLRTPQRRPSLGSPHTNQSEFKINSPEGSRTSPMEGICFSSMFVQVSHLHVSVLYSACLNILVHDDLYADYWQNYIWR